MYVVALVLLKGLNTSSTRAFLKQFKQFSQVV